jgi:hypothetical protein
MLLCPKRPVVLNRSTYFSMYKYLYCLPRVPRVKKGWEALSCGHKAIIDPIFLRVKNDPLLFSLSISSCDSDPNRVFRRDFILLTSRPHLIRSSFFFSSHLSNWFTRVCFGLLQTIENFFLRERIFWWYRIWDYPASGTMSIILRKLFTCNFFLSFFVRLYEFFPCNLMKSFMDWLV